MLSLKLCRMGIDDHLGTSIRAQRNMSMWHLKHIIIAITRQIPDPSKYLTGPGNTSPGPHRTWKYLTGPGNTSPDLTDLTAGPHRTWKYLTGPHRDLIGPGHTSPDLQIPHRTSPHRSSPDPTGSHWTSHN